MKTVRMKIDPSDIESLKVGRVNKQRVDSTTSAEVASHKLSDDAEAKMEAARSVRRKKR